MTPRTYDLYLLRRQKWSVWVPMVIMFVMPLAGWILFLTTVRPADAGFPRFMPFPFPFGIFWVVGFVYGWVITGTPYRITVDARDLIEFKSFRKTQHVEVRDILLIEPATARFVQMPFGQYRLTYRGGSIRFLGQFNDQHVLLSELAKANPVIVMKGC